MNFKKVIWIGSSKENLMTFPEPVVDTFGFVIHLAQAGDKHLKTKPLKGKDFKGASVLEIVEDHDGDTYRAVYTAKLKKAVYVLHCFQKKSKKGISTPKMDLELIKKRFKEAQNMEK